MNKKLTVFLVLSLFMFLAAAESFAAMKPITIQVFTSPKTVNIDGETLKGLKDFQYEVKSGTQIVSGSDDGLMMAYDGRKIEGRISLKGLSPVLDEHLKNGSSFNIEYFAAEKEGGKVKRTELLGAKVVKSFFSYDESGETEAVYLIDISEVREQ